MMSVKTRQMTSAIKAFEKDADVDVMHCIEIDINHFNMVCSTRLSMQETWDHVRDEMPADLRLSKVTFEAMFGGGLRADFLVEFDPE